MHVMILGAGGMLGQDLVATAPTDIVVSAFTRTELDITDTRALSSAVADAKPDVVINAAAYTAVDQAESEPELAFRVNGEGVGHLGTIAARFGIRVVHYSTDYVFDGTASRPYTEGSPTNPVNAYGASKLAGETALRESGAQFLILRSQWLFGVHGRSFPRTMYDRAKSDLATKVVADQTGRPTSTRDLAKVSWMLINRCAVGLLHVANAGEATWFDVAVHVFSRVGRRELLSPCSSNDYPTPARRPRYSALDTRHFEQRFEASLPAFTTALDDFLQRLTP
jgi:dTDP-4-dehydrorhamnose reductase